MSRVRHNEARQDEAGFTFLEVLVSMVIITIGVLAVTFSLANNSTATRSLSERQIAMQSALDFIEEVRATEFEQIYSTYRPGGTQGPIFFVPIFEQNTIGRIDFIVDERLRDQDLPVPLGFPRDLDGDGEATNPDSSLNPQILVAIVSVTWGRATNPQLWRVPVVIRKT